MSTETIKVLGQLVPGTTLSTLYTVPGATQATVSSVTVCNMGTATTFRLSVAVAGAADDPKQYLYYDLSVGAGDTFAATLGLTLGAGDVVRCVAGHASVSFNLFGAEVA